MAGESSRTGRWAVPTSSAGPSIEAAHVSRAASCSEVAGGAGDGR